MKKSILIPYVFLLLTMIIACEEYKFSSVENDGIPPASIKSAEVERLPGGARITYILPDDKDLLYVKATYTTKQGIVNEVKASYYTNSLLVLGFGDTAVYQVKLYAVDRGENASLPFSIDIRPMKPSILEAFENLTAKADFGGISIQCINESEADLAIVVLRKDSLGFYNVEDTHYSNSKDIQFSERGYDSIMTSFAFYVRDRWNNRSDTLFTDIKPIYEKELDKTLFKSVPLPTDAPVGWGLAMPGMWDDRVAQDASMWHSEDVGTPMWITFDLGVTARLSRLKLWERPGVYLFSHGNPKEYEVYGSTNPSVDGSWENWTKLVSCKSTKPSGRALGDNTNEDIAAGAEGEEWNIPLDAPEVRYIRIKILKTWSGGVAAHIGEISFWGSEQ